MKILFSANAPWCGSGYGMQSKLLTEFLIKHNHEIIFLTNFGLMGGSLKKNDILYLPSDMNDWCNSIISYNIELYNPDLIISLMDWFVFNTNEWSRNNTPWFNWTPIDLFLNEKDVPGLDKFVENCNVVTLSQFGSNQLRHSGFEPYSMIYHALDANLFKILDKKEARKFMELPDEPFVIGMNMANKDASENRKAFDLQFNAVKLFMDNNKDKEIVIYLNTEPSNKFGGHNLIELIEKNEINLEKVFFTHPNKFSCDPYKYEELPYLYNAFDVLMNASSGEGFGIPIIEAQACGVPVLTHDSTSMSEITFYGYKVQSDEKAKVIIEGYGSRKFPSIIDMAAGLQYIFENRSEKQAKEVSEFVRNTFDIGKIGFQWLNLIEDVS